MDALCAAGAVTLRAEEIAFLKEGLEHETHGTFGRSSFGD